MPNGFMPTYAYRPAVGGTNPTIRGRSTRRARLLAGGTYFRARDPGGGGNNISVQLIEWTAADGLHGQLIVTNHNINYSENLTGPASVDVLEQQLLWNETIIIDQLTTTPRARNSIRSQIAAGNITTTDLGGFSFSQLLYVPNKVSAKLTPKAAEITPTSVITIKPRVRAYDLVRIKVTPPPPDFGATVTGWDPVALRTAVNAGDPWIEMLPRSGDPPSDPLGPPVLPGPKFDAQDDGLDAYVLTTFLDTPLLGGDGLPDFPNTERSGPSRALVYVNYGERHDGTLAETNELYEWAGDSSTAGEWKKY